ncbi:helix-turn-helix domain-containing protein [Sporomusa sphaeroides]|uniref:helix-turn-helix domain-containing protein n=1 Tax=Sporomusa sphaeroides TaxID=47679 RepID=UPI003DA0E896
MAKKTRQGPFQNRVKDIRDNELNLTQQNIVDRLKKRGITISVPYLSQIEAGLKHIPYGLAVAICEELGYDSARVTEIFLPNNFTGSLECISPNSPDQQTSKLPKTG